MGLFSKRSKSGAGAAAPPARGVRPSAPAAAPAAGASAAAPGHDPALEQEIVRIGRGFLEKARGHRGRFLSAAFWSDKLMDWSMKDQAFKVQLFRFVDCFPALTTPDAVYDHLSDYLSQPGVTLHKRVNGSPQA